MCFRELGDGVGLRFNNATLAPVPLEMEVHPTTARALAH